MATFRSGLALGDSVYIVEDHTSFDTDEHWDAKVVGPLRIVGVSFKEDARITEPDVCVPNPTGPVEVVYELQVDEATVTYAGDRFVHLTQAEAEARATIINTTRFDPLCERKC